MIVEITGANIVWILGICAVVAIVFIPNPLRNRLRDVNEIETSKLKVKLKNEEDECKDDTLEKIATQTQEKNELSIEKEKDEERNDFETIKYSMIDSYFKKDLRGIENEYENKKNYTITEDEEKELYIVYLSMGALIGKAENIQILLNMNLQDMNEKQKESRLRYIALIYRNFEAYDEEIKYQKEKYSIISENKGKINSFKDIVNTYIYYKKYEIGIEEVNKKIEEAIKKECDNKDTAIYYSLLAEIYKAEALYENMFFASLMALKYDPTMRDMFFNIGYYCEDEERNDLRYYLYDKNIKTDSASWAAKNNLSILCGKYNLKYKEFKYLKDVKDQGQLPMSNYALILTMVGMYEEAEKEIKEFIDKNPDEKVPNIINTLERITNLRKTEDEKEKQVLNSGKEKFDDLQKIAENVLLGEKVIYNDEVWIDENKERYLLTKKNEKLILQKENTSLDKFFVMNTNDIVTKCKLMVEEKSIYTDKNIINEKQKGFFYFDGNSIHIKTTDEMGIINSRHIFSKEN